MPTSIHINALRLCRDTSAASVRDGVQPGESVLPSLHARLLARSGDPRATSSITLSGTGSVTDSQPNSASRVPIESCNPQPDEVVLWPSHSAIGRHCPEMSQVQCDRSGHSVPDAPSVSGFASVFQQVCLYRYPVHPRQAWDEKVEMCYLHIPLQLFQRAGAGASFLVVRTEAVWRNPLCRQYESALS